MSDSVVSELGPSSMIREASVAYLMAVTKQNRDTAIGQLVQWEEGRGDVPDSIGLVLQALDQVNKTVREALDKVKAAEAGQE